jgi:hypothetical protein
MIFHSNNKITEIADHNSIEALVLINNSVSARIAREMLYADGISLKRTALILLREVDASWFRECRICIRYGEKPKLNMLGQYKFIDFYVKSANIIKNLISENNLRVVYVVNNDNILTNALFIWSEDHKKLVPDITVIAEGIMNYQQIDVRDRASWRWRIKPVIAMLLGLPYRTPSSHLSGSFEKKATRTISFAAGGLKAPIQNISLVPYPKVLANHAPEPGTCLIVHTGLWQWMPESEYLVLAVSFANWIKEQGFTRIIAKEHPHIPTGPLKKLLPPHDIMEDQRPVEEMASEISACTIVGTCCTALITLKQMRADLTCVDYGSNHYCKHAYHGDNGVIDLMRSVDVKIVDHH